MEKLNIIYDDMMDDVDIIAVPNEIYQDIEQLVDIFMEWLIDDAPKNDQDYWITLNGKQHMNLETKGFVKWLNNYRCQNCDKVYIVKQHTEYCSEFKHIEF